MKKLNITKISARLVQYQSKLPSAFLFTPGLLLIGISIAVVVAPSFVLTLVAGLFLLVGILSCMAAWKLIQWKNKVEKIAKDLQGKVFVQGVSLRNDALEDILEEAAGKKNFFH